MVDRLLLQSFCLSNRWNTSNGLQQWHIYRGLRAAVRCNAICSIAYTLPAGCEVHRCSYLQLYIWSGYAARRPWWCLCTDGPRQIREPGPYNRMLCHWVTV